MTKTHSISLVGMYHIDGNSPIRRATAGQAAGVGRDKEACVRVRGGVLVVVGARDSFPLAPRTQPRKSIMAVKPPRLYARKQKASLEAQTLSAMHKGEIANAKAFNAAFLPDNHFLNELLTTPVRNREFGIGYSFPRHLLDDVVVTTSGDLTR